MAPSTASGLAYLERLVDNVSKLDQLDPEPSHGTTSCGGPDCCIRPYCSPSIPNERVSWRRAETLCVALSITGLPLEQAGRTSSREW